MDVPSATISAGHTLRALQLHVTRRDGGSSVSSGDSDSYRHHHHQPEECAHHQYCNHVPPPRPLLAPMLSLTRILEQRNLLPLHIVVNSSAYSAAAVAASSTGSVDFAVHSLLPSLRFTPRVVQAGAIDRLNASSTQGWTMGGDLDHRHAAQQRHRSSHPEALFLHDERQSPSQPLTKTARTGSPPAPAPRPQASSGAETASRGFGHSRRPTMTVAERRVARTCTIDGCTNYIVDRHLCFRHGGGRRCSIDGCASSAKQFGLCWRHGGSVLCKIEGCTRGVKVNGFCWGHGGGKKKNQQATSAAEVTVAVRQDSAVSPVSRLRCLFDGCQKTPVLSSFCKEHCRKVTRPGYVFEL